MTGAEGFMRFGEAVPAENSLWGQKSVQELETYRSLESELRQIWGSKRGPMLMTHDSSRDSHHNLIAQHTNVKMGTCLLIY